MSLDWRDDPDAGVWKDWLGDEGAFGPENEALDELENGGLEK